MRKSVYLILPVMALLLACSLPWMQPVQEQPSTVPATETPLLVTATVETPEITTTPTGQPDEPSIAEPLLTEKSILEENEDPYSVIEVYYPYLEGVPRAAIFNQQVETFINQNIDSFTFDLEQLEGDWRKVESFFAIHYEVTHASPELISVLFNLSFYVAGAAHPGQDVHSENYDVKLGRFIELPELFIAGSDYLEIISVYCIDDLNSQGLLAWEEGAEPALDNYRTWNVSEEGIVISFPPYQVAPGAAGLLTVKVPFDRLQEVIRPDGLLAAWLQ